ncbi:hypothetical protein Ahy_B06g084427 isoform B [Arachis hypogaea]|uniref:RNase H type-1 domain-containing protein n=1 Tax=Arachis hypogaea TaxID=3818 RepID=A0A444YRX1_ARAHY|nr:hypothetical protein Ahy_B06g084427 isoform B [Arachis hypogaea]
MAEEGLSEKNASHTKGHFSSNCPLPFLPQIHNLSASGVYPNGCDNAEGPGSKEILVILTLPHYDRFSALEFQALLQHGQLMSHHSISFRWSPSPLVFVKVNSDGTVFMEPQQSAFGTVIRNADGSWVKSCSGTCLHHRPLHAELLTIYCSLQLAWECGFRGVYCAEARNL